MLPCAKTSGQTPDANGLEETGKRKASQKPAAQSPQLGETEGGKVGVSNKGARSRRSVQLLCAHHLHLQQEQVWSDTMI